MAKPKISKTGLNLRKKSKIHETVLDKKTGRRNTDVTDRVYHEIEKLIINKSKPSEKWHANGEMVRRKFVNAIRSERKNLINLYNKTKKPIDIMILGPGKGKETDVIKNELSTASVKNNIDVLGLSKSIDPKFKKNVRQDYSPKVPEFKKVFEHMNHLKLTNKYSLIYSNLGPIFHSRYPEVSILKIATMLKKEGVAILEFDISFQSLTKYLSHNFASDYAIKKEIIKRVGDYLDKQGYKDHLNIEFNDKKNILKLRRVK